MNRIRLLLATLCLAACAGAPSKPAPDRRVEVRPLRGTERFRVAAEGFEPAIAVEGVREAELPLAERVVHAAVVALDDEAPRAGLELDLPLGETTSRVKLVSTTGGSVLLVDLPPDGSEVLPRRALATAAVAAALQAREDGDSATARRLAEQAVELAPGDPLAARPEENEPHNANHQNYLAHALLAKLSDGAIAERHYLDALARSARYLESELGATPTELLESEHLELVARAHAIAEANVSSQGSSSGGAVRIGSPIWDAAGSRQPVILPRPFLDLFATGPGGEALRDPSLRLLAVRAFERLRDDPVALLLSTREVRSLLLDEPLVASPLPEEGAPETKMLSALLADVARKSAAGLSQSEIEATLGFSAPPEQLASARAKLRLQREREFGWYASALGG